MSYQAYLKSEKFSPGNNYSVYEGELELSQFNNNNNNNNNNKINNYKLFIKVL